MNAHHNHTGDYVFFGKLVSFHTLRIQNTSLKPLCQVIRWPHIWNLDNSLLGPNSFNLTFNQTCAIIWGVGALGGFSLSLRCNLRKEERPSSSHQRSIRLWLLWHYDYSYSEQSHKHRVWCS